MQIFYYPVHGEPHWLYAVEVTPCTTRVFEARDTLQEMIEIDALLDQACEHSDEGGSSTEEEIEYYSLSDDDSSTTPSLDGDNSSDVDLPHADDDIVSQMSFRCGLEIALDIDPSNLRADMLAHL